MSGVSPADLDTGKREYGLLTRRRPFHCITTSALVWEFLGRFFPRFFTTALLLILFAPFSRGSQAQTLPAQPTPSNSAKQSRAEDTQAPRPAQFVDQTIPLPLIADRAEQLDRLLEEINNQLIPKSVLLESGRKAAAQAAEMRRRSLQSGELLAGDPTSLDLEDEQRYWRSRGLEYTEERKLLTWRAGKLQEQVQTLEDQQREWAATWLQFLKTPGIETTVERMKQQLDKIQSVKSQVQEQLNVVVSLQNQVSQQEQQISDMLLRVRQARERERGHLFEMDGRPLWEGNDSQASEQEVSSSFRRSVIRSFKSARAFLGSHIPATFILATFYLLSLLGVFNLRRYAMRAAPTEIPAEALQVFARPYSVSLLVVLLIAPVGTGQKFSLMPIAVAFIFYLLHVVPVLRLLTLLIEPKLRIFLYVLAIFYVLCGVYLLVQLPKFFRREVYTLLIFAALVSFGWLARNAKINPSLKQDRKVRARSIGIFAGLVILGASLLANVVGFVSLGQVLGLTVLVGTFVAAAFLCAVRVLTFIFSTVLHSNWARSMLEARTDAVERWSCRALSLAALLLWLRAMLRLLAVYEGVVGTLSGLIHQPIGFDGMYFTVGGALTVVFILVFGYALANGSTLLLKKIVLPKLSLNRGVPYAISTITYYVLLLVVVSAALSAAGVQLNKFTVLTGALGVGLGFGLQNVVNNFVSGLILLFERPIHVGDTVDVGGLVGEVRRIGTRSSTIVTFQGAEVIVPNNNLIANQVINWTLSSQWRRVDIPIGVAYGTDPERVIKLLVGVAESHPRVLLVRPPMAFFLGFGESALKFELRFWAAQQDTWFQLQSDVTVAVAKALREAGIEIPFPQRDLHIRSVDSVAANAETTEGDPTSALLEDWKSGTN
jgi:small-conductance mechanosensitive channel